MYERKEKDVNSYFPTFFYTYLNIPDDPQYLGRYPLDERSEAFFLHEYIHYLQDLTTTSGYARIESIVDQVKWAVSEAGKRGKLRIPLNPFSTWSYNMMPNASCLKISAGEMKKKSSNGVDLKYDSPKELKLTEQLTPIKNGRNIRVKAITSFVFEDSEHHEYEYKIGEMAISESMAYIVENHIYPGVLEESSDFPYKVVRNVVSWKCPKAIDDFILVAICDVCLMYSFPGVAFYYLIEYLNHYDGEVSPELIYLYGFGTKMCEKMCTQFWLEHFTHTNKLAINQLRDYFNHPYWSGIEYTLTTSLINAYGYRKNKPSFIMDIMRGGRICHNSAFQDALSYMGCLAIHTAKNMLFYFPPRGAENIKVDPDWFVCLYQLYRVLFSKDAIEEIDGHTYITWKCSLKDWCQNSFEAKNLPDITSTSYNCVQEPWLNTADELMAQCAFGRLWAAYNLTRIKLKPNNR